MGLNDYAKQAGKKYFGTAADLPESGEMTDKYYMKQFNNTHDFGQATAANVMKWAYVEETQGKYDFSWGDQFVKIAKANNQLIRCHNLIWHIETPWWFGNVNWTKASMLAAVETRVKTAVAHYGNSCYCWDVVNEALNDDGTYRQSIFYNLTGTEYITTAYRTAQQVIAANKLKVKLYYNDYSIESLGPKVTGVQNNIVQFLRKQKIQIDGIGLQSHFVAGDAPTTEMLMQSHAAFAAMGLETAVTEMDVRLQLPATQLQLAQQIADYNSTAAACVLSKSCVGMTLWDFVDTYSWVPSWFPGWGGACPWWQPKGADTPLVRKVAYYGIVSGLEANIRSS